MKNYDTTQYSILPRVNTRIWRLEKKHSVGYFFFHEEYNEARKIVNFKTLIKISREYRDGIKNG